MNNFLEFIKKALLFEAINERLKEIWKRLQEIKPYSWETLLLLSIFSWLISLLLENPFLKDVLAVFGWLFLIFGVGWALADNKLPIPGLPVKYGPWITGALTTVFLFQTQILNEQYSTALIAYPLISAIIAALPAFIAPGPTFKTPDVAGRQSIVVIVLVGSLISCWIQFYYVLQGWLADYPSLLADSFARSNFVVRLDSDAINPPKGILILNSAEAILQEQLGNRPLAAVERWLLNIDNEVAQLEFQVKSSIAHLDESQFWHLRATIPPGSPDYTLRLEAIWQGPSSQLGGYTLEKTCRIGQVYQRPTSASDNTTLVTTRVTCEPVVLPEFLRTRT